MGSCVFFYYNYDHLDIFIQEYSRYKDSYSQALLLVIRQFAL